MADEYIRRQDVLKGKKTGTFANGICLVAEPCVTVEYIESLEPADVVSVVRCADCERSEYDVVFEQYWCNLKRIVRPDGYCNYGKRREE